MVTIYDMQTGTIVSENDGVTTVGEYAAYPECRLSLQPVVSETAASPVDRSACSEYMALFDKLLRDF